ncbi:MAG: hypothetical protein G01um101418_447 [Parcubacteria group bacterium Gr01-1014_18]|nr:MAG: hypothetical protein Greene041636_492 [Parcubacteria group bacterium Greene0416_36]TSC81034.1 MAG: hypothetical protein G01um101418_447 [Parcubacteria group bacterium Gr01-1014_18]TSC98956.1 MAG: hypothetical protein Greene101420_468 [Parcubacteria group bacterium Greene1014_20]TSD06752.1 MAG: hypothetical protein Greene07142_673 [Parcubacteria group bacterium Greene0714_2]
MLSKYEYNQSIPAKINGITEKHAKIEMEDGQSILLDLSKMPENIRDQDPVYITIHNQTQSEIQQKILAKKILNELLSKK